MTYNIQIVPLEKVNKKLLVDLFNNPLVKRHMPLSEKVFTLEDYNKFIDDKLAIWDSYGFGPSAYYIDNDFVGWGGIQPFSDNFEIALVLDPKKWGLGKILYKNIIKDAFTRHHLRSVDILLPLSRKTNKWLLKEGFIIIDTVNIQGHSFNHYRIENPNNSIIIKSKNEELRISHYDQLPSAYKKAMERSLISYEKNHNVNVNHQSFSIILTINNALIGVLNAYTAYAEIYVDDLWVSKNYRHKGYGKLLLQSLEDQYRDKGFNNINLVTSAFQAPDFYRKCGFTEEFVRVNRINPKFTKYFFIKYFSNPNQNQGIVVKS